MYTEGGVVKSRVCEVGDMCIHKGETKIKGHYEVEVRR